MSIKLREAVESLLDLLDDFAVTEEIVSIAHENQCHKELLHTDKTLAVLQKAKAALAEPIRNCGLYDSEEDAWNAYLQLHPNAECPNDKYEMWLFDPAEMKGETK